MALKAISNWAKKQGYKYKRSLQSALFTMSWYDAEEFKKGNRGFPTFSITGWHGSGKGNRNYGSTFMVHTAYGKSYKDKFDVRDRFWDLPITSRGEYYFNSLEEKKIYISRIELMMKTITSGNMDKLWSK